MISRNLLLALFAALALALGPSAAVVAADGGASVSAKSKKGKKKGSKGKKRACKKQGKRGGKGKAGKRQGKGGKSAAASARSKKGKKGKGKKGKSRGCKGKGGKSAGTLANGRYDDPKAGVGFKVTGGGRKIQLEKIEFRRLCIALEVGSDNAVPLKARKGAAVARDTFTVSGGTVITVNWSVEIDPGSLRYSLEYTVRLDIPGSEGFRPCEDKDRFGGKLSR